MTLATCARGRASDVTCLRQSSKESDSKSRRADSGACGGVNVAF